MLRQKIARPAPHMHAESVGTKGRIALDAAAFGVKRN